MEITWADLGDRKWVSVPDAAALTGCTRQAIEQAIRVGGFASRAGVRKPFRARQVAVASLREWQRARYAKALELLALTPNPD